MARAKKSAISLGLRAPWGWIPLGAGIIGGFLYWLAPVLTPFILGFAIAYFLDPVADRLEKFGMPRLVAVGVIGLAFLCLVVGFTVFGLPRLVESIAEFWASLPDKLFSLEVWLENAIPVAMDIDALAQFSDFAASSSRNGLNVLFRGGLSFLSLLGLVVITPIVAVYLLYDWDHMMEQINGLLGRHFPKRRAELVRRLAGEVNETLAAFARGQLSVCFILGVFYSVALFWIGLDGAVVLGMSAGAVSFVPYAGAAFGIIVALMMALAQFGADWVMLGLVGGVFIVGQAVEGNVLTPFLVGERVRLHPVWVIFALFAFGQMFGFLGLLLAMPLAAAAGVAVRFALRESLRK